MKTTVSSFALIAAALAAPALAESSRGLGAHEHGHGSLNMAVEGDKIVMELEAPGADIVGFEYEAKSAEDRAAVDEAIAALAKPLELFVPPADAGCVVTAANVALITEDEEHGDNDDHDDHAHDDEKHEDEHAHDDEHHEDEHAHDDHKHDDEHAHDDEKHEDEHAHDDEHHHDEEHAEEEGSHTEFHAEYALTCSDPSAITTMQFVYFERFPNAEELEVQFISEVGAKGFEVGKDDPVLDLAGSI